MINCIDANTEYKKPITDHTYVPCWDSMKLTVHIQSVVNKWLSGFKPHSFSSFCVIGKCYFRQRAFKYI